MIYAVAGKPFEARTVGFATGLVGTIGVRVLDNIGGTPLARTTAGIIQDPAGLSSYVAVITLPDNTPVGQYAVMFDAAGREAYEDLVLSTSLSDFPGFPDDAWVPEVDDVAKYLRSRTRNQFGVEVGTFTDDTAPTAAGVADLIGLAVANFTARFGTEIVASDAGNVRALLAIRTAMLVELSYFPDQIRVDRSPYNELKALYEEMLASVIIDPDTVTPERTSLAPAFVFPPPPIYDWDEDSYANNSWYRDRWYGRESL